MPPSVLCCHWITKIRFLVLYVCMCKHTQKYTQPSPQTHTYSHTYVCTRTKPHAQIYRRYVNKLKTHSCCTHAYCPCFVSLLKVMTLCWFMCYRPPTLPPHPPLTPFDVPQALRCCLSKRPEKPTARSLAVLKIEHNNRLCGLYSQH